jgi:hypothetical protein
VPRWSQSGGLSGPWTVCARWRARPCLSCWGPAREPGRPPLRSGPHAPKAAPRITQRGHEQTRFAVALCARHTGGGTFSVVDLHFFTRGEGEAVELFGRFVAQRGAETFDAVVGSLESMLVDQVLVDGHGVTTQAQLGIDEGAMGLALGGARLWWGLCGCRRRYRCRYRCGRGRGRRGCSRFGSRAFGGLSRLGGCIDIGSHNSRWPGWGNLLRWVGGHPGAVCGLFSHKALLVGPDGVRGNTRDAFDLSLTCVGLEQRPDGGLQMWFQNVHSSGPLGFKGKESNVLPVLTLADQRTRSMRQFTIARVEQFDWPQVGQFGWPSGGPSFTRGQG